MTCHSAFSISNRVSDLCQPLHLCRYRFGHLRWFKTWTSIYIHLWCDLLSVVWADQSVFFACWYLVQNIEWNYLVDRHSVSMDTAVITILMYMISTWLQISEFNVLFDIKYGDTLLVCLNQAHYQAV